MTLSEWKESCINTKEQLVLVVFLDEIRYQFLRHDLKHLISCFQVERYWIVQHIDHSLKCANVERLNCIFLQFPHHKSLLLNIDLEEIFSLGREAVLQLTIILVL